MSVTRALLIAILSLALSCSHRGRNAGSKRLDTLEESIEQNEQRLSAVKKEIEASEARAQKARQEAEFQECRSKVELFRAQAAVHQTQCMGDLAGHNQCLARQSRKKAGFTAGGCALGIIATLATAGAGAGLAIGGCAAGGVAGLASEKECSLPSCARTFNEPLKAVLPRHGLSALPRCGGYLGVEVEDVTSPLRWGAQVDRIGPGTLANDLALLPSDVIVVVNGRRVRDGGSAEAAVRQVPPGYRVQVGYYRGGRHRQAQTRAKTINTHGERTSRSTFGATWRRRTKADWVSAVRVTAVEPRSPAAHAGLRVGDELERLNREPIESKEHLEDLLRGRRAGSRTVLGIEGGNGRRDVTVVLRPRSNHQAL